MLEAASAPVISSDVKQAEEASAGSKTEALNDRLRKLINQSPAVLFMKGSADIPQCGNGSKFTALIFSNFTSVIGINCRIQSPGHCSTSRIQGRLYYF